MVKLQCSCCYGLTSLTLKKKEVTRDPFPPSALRNFQGFSFCGTVYFLSLSCIFIHLPHSFSPVSVSLSHPLFHLAGDYPGAKEISLYIKSWKILYSQEAAQGTPCATQWLLSLIWERCHSFGSVHLLAPLIWGLYQEAACTSVLRFPSLTSILLRVLQRRLQCLYPVRTVYPSAGNVRGHLHKEQLLFGYCWKWGRRGLQQASWVASIPSTGGGECRGKLDLPVILCLSLKVSMASL